MDKKQFEQLFLQTIQREYPLATLTNHVMEIPLDFIKKIQFQIDQVHDPKATDNEQLKKIHFAISDVMIQIQNMKEITADDMLDFSKIKLLIQTPKSKYQEAISDLITDQTDDLKIFYCIDTPELIIYLHKQMLQVSKSSIDDIRKEAAKNTKKQTIIKPETESQFEFPFEKSGKKGRLVCKMELYNDKSIYNAQFLLNEFYESKPSKQTIILFLDVQTTVAIYVPNDLDFTDPGYDQLKDQIRRFCKDLQREYQKDNETFPFVLFLKKQKDWTLF